MTDSKRAGLRRLHEAATPGPWEAQSTSWPRTRQKGEWWQIWAQHQGGRTLIADIARTDTPSDKELAQDRANGSFIAAARAAVPALLDEVDALRAAGRALLPTDNDEHCRWCGWCWRWDRDNHDANEPDCPRSTMRALLGARK